MASEVVQNSTVDRNVLKRTGDRNVLIRDEPRDESNMDLDIIDPAQEGLTASTYTLASTQSQFSNALDHWIRGSPAIAAISHTANTAVQDSRTLQQNSGIWYILTMILPLFSLNATTTYWGCSASTFLHAAELLASQVGHVGSFFRRHLRRLAQDRVARDIFATVMDVVLIIYALGFLLLSMYQASIFD